MRRVELAVGVLLVLAGCLGTGEDQGPTSDPGPGAGTEEPTRTWETVTREGTVTGAGTPAGSISQGGGNTATWTVPANTTILYLNVTAQGGEVSVEYGPDCNTEQTVECPYNTTTQDGEASTLHRGPATGGWEAYFFLQNNAGSVDWTLEATVGIQEA